MISAKKRKREGNSQRSYSGHSFNSINGRDPWQEANERLNSLPHDQKGTPGTPRMRLDEIESMTLLSSSAARHHDKPHQIHTGAPQSINNHRVRAMSQSINNTQQESGKKFKKMDKKKDHQRRSQPVDSPFVPDAVSTPAHNIKPKPIPIKIPVDPRLKDEYIKYAHEKMRRQAREYQANQTFESQIPSSPSTAGDAKAGSGSEQEDDDPAGDNDANSNVEGHDTPSPDPKLKPLDLIAKSKDKTSERLKKEVTKHNPTESSKPAIIPVKEKSKGPKFKTTTGKEAPTSTLTLKPQPTTSQTNTTLESTLFASLQNLIPQHLTAHAHSALTSEVQFKAKNLHNPELYAGHSSGPSDRAVALRAAHDLIVRLSVQRLAGSLGLAKAGSGSVLVGGLLSPNITTADMGSGMQSDLARIASERGKRIEDLEMENRGLKGRVERVRVKVEERSEDGDKKRRKKG